MNEELGERWRRASVRSKVIGTQDVVPALQLEGVRAAAHSVDVVAQLVHAAQALRHHHLLVHQVGLRQVVARLRTITGRFRGVLLDPP